MLSNQGGETHEGGLRNEEGLQTIVVTKNASSPMMIVTKIST